MTLGDSVKALGLKVLVRKRDDETGLFVRQLHLESAIVQSSMPSLAPSRYIHFFINALN